MTDAAGAYLFVLGLATGIALLTLTSVRRVSPAWLRGLLIAGGLLVIGRYVTMARCALTEAPQAVGAWHRLWFASSLGLTLPSVVAVDQLVRHPAMTPQRVLRWYAPFGLAFAALLVFGQAAPVADRFLGWAPRLGPDWRLAATTAHSVFTAGFLVLCLTLLRKLPSRPVRAALGGLVLGYASLGVDGLLVAFGGWYVRPFLYSEVVTLLALWQAYETSSALQRL
jgi:hypothetical protein